MVSIVGIVRVIAVLAGVVTAPAAWACSCIEWAPEDFATEAAIVFEGRLLRTEPAPLPGGPGPKIVMGTPVEGVFKVQHVYKGDLGRQVRVRYNMPNGSNCGPFFNPYENVTVAAHGDAESGYITSACSSVNYEPFRTQVLEAIRRRP